jgi:hypothetical protein
VNKSDKAHRIAARTARPAAAPAVAKKAPDTAPRARKAAPGAAPQVDSDVALISAIIAQSERHRGERDERNSAGACAGPKCPPKAHP